MKMYIFQNAYYNYVVQDLRKLCPDPGLKVNSFTGEVTYAPTMSSPGSQLLTPLATSPVGIGIQGQPGSFPIPEPAAPLQKLSDRAGYTLYDTYPGTTTIDIVYDVENGQGCSGRGYIVEGDNQYVDFPTHVSLLHELVHAKHLVTMGFSAGIASAENDAIREENAYRQFVGLPRRGGYNGGCKAAPPQQPKQGGETGGTGNKNQTGPPPTRPGGCFVATAALEGRDDEKLDFLRSFRDGPIAATRRGAQFFEDFYSWYYQVSPAVANAIREDASLRRLVAAGMAVPLVNYLRWAVNFPEAEIPAGLPQQWASYLEAMRDDLESWASDVLPPLTDRPQDFTDDDILRDVVFTLRYVLRSPERRRAYIETVRTMLDPELYSRVRAHVEEADSRWE
jgi:hypothetical protein